MRPVFNPSSARAPLLVLADDLTGAAEVAGIGHVRGLQTRLFSGEPEALDALALAGSGMLVVNTESRLLKPEKAANRVEQFLAALSEHRVFFKKTDSVLRGPVLAELSVFLNRKDSERVVLLPQNPGMDRVIKDGVYRIGRVPLHETAFAADPDYPALSSEVEHLVRRGDLGMGVQLLKAGRGIPSGAGVYLCEADDLETVHQWADKVSEGALAAGGSEFFEALLEVAGVVALTATGYDDDRALLPRLFFSGSAHADSEAAFQWLAKSGVSVRTLAGDHLAAESPEVADTIEGVKEALQAARPLALRIRGPAVEGEEGSARVLQRFIEQVDKLLSCFPSVPFYIEGGSTAGALMKRRGWTHFEVLRSWSRGAVTLRVAGSSIIFSIKPSSFAWPQAWLEPFLKLPNEIE